MQVGGPPVAFEPEERVGILLPRQLRQDTGHRLYRSLIEPIGNEGRGAVDKKGPFDRPFVLPGFYPNSRAIGSGQEVAKAESFDEMGDVSVARIGPSIVEDNLIVPIDHLEVHGVCTTGEIPDGGVKSD